MASLSRLRKEFVKIQKDPVPNIEACPLESNLLEWHYVITGPAGSPYEGGIYHGKLKFPNEYPYKPPAIMMCTPNGRFETNKRLCLSMSDFHPESWNPLWSVSSILTGLLSFMLENNATYGSIDTTTEEKRRLAQLSWDFNMKSATFLCCFPHYKEKYAEVNQKRQQRADELQAKNDAALAQPGASEKRPDDLSDKLIIFAVIAVIAFALSWLYY